MRKWLMAFLVLLLLIVGAGVGAYLYVSPSEKLDLQYKEVPLESRALDMAKRRSLKLNLTEEDVNNLAKAQIAANPNYRKGIEVTGLNFHLSSGKLIADVNLKAFNRVPVGMQLTYEVKWVSPNLVATVTEARIKRIHLPADSFNEVVIPLASQLPSVLKVKQVQIGDDQVTIEFKQPSLSDLSSLIS